MFDAILFDFDGTLVDTREDIFASLNHALAAVGRPARTLAEVTGFIGDGVAELIKRSLSSGAEDVLEEALSVFREHYGAHCVERSHLYPRVRETLERLSGKPLAVVTNKPEAVTKTMLRRLNLDSFFSVVLGGDSLPTRKPHPGPLTEALGRLGVRAGKGLMVGDSRGDVDAGRAAGVRTCGVTYGYRPEQELRDAKADFIIKRFSDLEDILKENPR